MSVHVFQEPKSETNSYQLTRDRQRRNIKPPERFGYADVVTFALYTAQGIENQEPQSFEEALRHTDSREWQKAMKVEMDSLIKNQTWILVEKPTKHKIVDVNGSTS